MSDQHSLPALPARGGFSLARCPNYQGTAYLVDDRCAGCHHIYRHHRLITPTVPADGDSSPVVAFVPSPESTSTSLAVSSSIPASQPPPPPARINSPSTEVHAWQNPFSPAGPVTRAGTNSRRRAASQRNGTSRTGVTTGVATYQGLSATTVNVIIRIYILPGPSYRSALLEYPPFVPAVPVELNQQKLGTIVRRMHFHELVVEITIPSTSTANTIYTAVTNAVQSHCTSKELFFPTSLDPSDTTVTWLFLNPGHSNTRTGSAMRKMKPDLAFDNPAHWTFAELGKVSRKLTLTLPRGTRAANYNIWLGPRFGLLTKQRHPCILVRILFQTDENSNVVAEPGPRECLPACPSTSLQHVTATEGAHAEEVVADSEDEVDTELLPPPSQRRRLSVRRDSLSEGLSFIGRPPTPEPFPQPIRTAAQFFTRVQPLLPSLAPTRVPRILLNIESDVSMSDVYDDFMAFISCKISGGEPPISPYLIIRGRELPLAYWLNPQDIRVKYGNGIGNGPKVQFFSGLFPYLVTQNIFWEPVVGDMFALRTDIAPSPARLEYCAAVGAALAICTQVLEHFPLGISPAFIQATHGGLKSLDNTEWIASLSPSFAEILRLWPVDEPPSSTLGTPAQRLELVSRLSEGTTLSIASLQSVPPSEVKDARLCFLCRNLIGAPHHLIWKCSIIVTAFRRGYSIPLYETPITWRQALGPGESTFSLMTSLTPNIISSVENVLNRMSWRSEVNDLLSTYELRFKELFEQYLHGTGCPDASIFRDGLPEEDWMKMSQDVLLRARCFVEFISGTSVLCHESETYNMEFIRSTDEDDRSIRYNRASVCTKTIMIALGQAWKNVLDSSATSSATTPQFDVIFHALIVNFADVPEGYNTL